VDDALHAAGAIARVGQQPRDLLAERLALACHHLASAVGVLEHRAHAIAEQVEVEQDVRQRVVDFVGQPGGEHAHRGQEVGLHQARLQLLALAHVAGDDQHRGFAVEVDGRRGHLEHAVLPVAAEDAEALQRPGHLLLEGGPHALDGRLTLVGVHHVRQRPAHQLVEARGTDVRQDAGVGEDHDPGAVHDDHVRQALDDSAEARLGAAQRLLGAAAILDVADGRDARRLPLVVALAGADLHGDGGAVAAQAARFVTAALAAGHLGQHQGARLLGHEVHHAAPADLLQRPAAHLAEGAVGEDHATGVGDDQGVEGGLHQGAQRRLVELGRRQSRFGRGVHAASGRLALGARALSTDSPPTRRSLSKNAGFSPLQVKRPRTRPFGSWPSIS
jgi:hypothetical protein